MAIKIQNGDKMAIKWRKNGDKMEQNGDKMATKWRQNGEKMR